MTKVYFIRHAQSDYSVRNSRVRPLTEKGRNDCRLVMDFLNDKNIGAVFSSPYKRAIDTLADFAKKSNFEIQIIEAFRECRGDSEVRIDKTAGHRFKDNEDSVLFFRRQWADFNYTLSDGERLSEVQERNINALKKLLFEYKGKNIAIGTHGVALSTIINYYDNAYGFEDFLAMADITPWVVRMSFDGNSCVEIEKVNLFE